VVLFVINLSPRLFVGVEFFWNVGVERGEADSLFRARGLRPFLRRNKLRVFVAPRASARECFVVDADISCVDVVFGPAASGDVAV